MDAIKKSVCRTEKEAALQTPDPFQLAQFNQLKGRLDNFENKQACAPAYEDVEQLKDYVRERSKKLKATLVNLQQQMERRFDQRLKDQIGNFGIWQANFTQVNSGRQQVLEDKIGENYTTAATICAQARANFFPSPSFLRSRCSCARRSSSVAAASWKPLRRSTSRRSPCSVLLSQGSFASSEDAIRGESAAVDREGGSKPRMLAEAPSWGSLGAGRAQIALPQGKEGKPKLWGHS